MRTATRQPRIPEEAVPSPVPTRPGGVLALQRTVGNAALARQVRPVQRGVSWRGLVGTSGACDNVASLGDDIEKLVKAVDTKVQTARMLVLRRPLFTGLEGLKTTDGHVARWVLCWRNYVDNGIFPGIMAASFGYVVESLTTHLLGGSAEGWTLSYQIAAGSTRPDIVAEKGGAYVWLDLTAADSAGHIYSLKDWRNPKQCPHPHAEITYDGLDGGSQSYAVKSAQKEIDGDARSAAVDVAALDAKIKRAKKLHQARLADWEQRLGGELDGFLAGKLAKPSVHGRDAKNAALVFDWFGQKYPTAGLDRLTQEHWRIIASVLKLFGMTGAKYGFWAYTVSTSRGCAFLEKFDRDLLQEKDLPSGH